MNLTAARNAVTSKLGRKVLLAQKHSPTVLFASGVVGVVTTVVLASRATLKLEEVLEEAEDKKSTATELFEAKHANYSAKDYKRDVGILWLRTAGKVSKLYAPALAVGAVSVGCLTGSHVILTQRNAGLVAAYAAVEKGFSEYRQRVLAEVGEDKERELRYGFEAREFVEDTKQGPKVTTQNRVDPNTKSAYARFFDELCAPWVRTPEYNFLFLRAQQNYCNDMLRSRGHLFLNEVYDMLGIERCKAGAVVGWVLNGEGDDFVDFGVFDGDNPRARDFVNGREGSILLDFNVDGVIYDKI